MRMKRHDDSQRGGRLAVTQPVYPALPLYPANHFSNRQAEKQLTAPADRGAGAFAFTTAVVAWQLALARSIANPACRPPVPSPATSNPAGSSPATDCRQNRPPALPAVPTRCFADHRCAWRCEAGPDIRRAVGVRMMGRARGSHPASVARLRQAASVSHLAGHRLAQETKKGGAR